MAGVLVPLIFFMSVTAWVLGPRFLRMWHEQRLREIEARARQPQLLAPAPITAQVFPDDERKQLEERLRTLETIVCSVDYELNSKLNRLASRQIRALPAAPLAGDLETAPTHPSTPPPAHAHGHGTSLAPGQKLAQRFVLERPLGEGGMGSVWLARDEKLGEAVAVKVIRDALLADPSIIERFKREVSAARRVQHANVVRLHDLGEENGQLFLSMEYVQGESLGERIKRRGPLPMDEVRMVAAQMCDALEAAHGAGVIHRDLKPANVLLTFHGSSPHIKVIDFGVAKLSHLEGMTATSLILGTPEYMAPEQIRGKTVDNRSDLYALGIILHEALLGKTPFRGESAIAVGFAACTNTVPPLKSTRADVPDAWDHFVRRALEKDPDDRFASAADMKRAIPA